MRKLNSQFISTFVSEAGLDGQNGTYYGFVEMDQYYCMAVAEGYDGDGGGESAKLAVDAAIEAFVQKPGITAGKIRTCLKKAHQCLKEHSVRIRLKAGILLLVSDYTRFRYGVCGNVMLYGFRNAGIFHQSVTHTVYQTMADRKQIIGEETGPKEETRNLYHYLGGSGRILVSGKIRLEEGDILLAATEGFWNRINRVEILDAYESIQSVEEFLGDLQELYLRGSTENIPCCCLAAVEIKKAYQENTALKKKIWIWCLIILLILAVGGTALFFYIRGKRRRQREIRNTIAVYEDTGDQYMTNLNSLLAKQEYEKASEESKKLDKNEERLERERLISEKIHITTMIENAGKFYDSRNYTQARDEYKRALEIVEKYEELFPLIHSIEQKQKLVSAGMEIDSFMESAALKEAGGDMENAGILYKRAEAMLRIVDDPERLKEVQLALLRVKEQADQEIKEERAKTRDEVIIDADKTAALSAILAGDFETALEQYTKIRDSYIAMEENEKAEETTQIILSLQKQAREIEELASETIDGDESEALSALAAGDLETALMMYEKVQKAYAEMGNEAGAQEIAVLIESLQEQIDSAPEMEELEPSQESGPEQDTQPEPGQERPVIPSGEKLPAAPGQDERQILLDQAVERLLNEMLHAIARQDFASAMNACQEIENLSAEYGDSKTVGTEQIIEGLKKLMEEANGGPGGIEMDESFIYERLKALSGGLERSGYRDISKAFEEVVRYNEKALEELKQSLHKELRDVSERFYLYGAVAAAGDVPIVNDFLFSMDDGREEGSIATIFCQCSRSRMEELFKSSQEMIVETEEGETEITVWLRPCKRYQKKIEELKNLFYENGVFWRTPYLPYVDRFGDVFCENFNPDWTIRSVRFKSVDIPVGVGLIPLWNVEPISLKCTVFPIPAMDEQNFRHTLKLPFWQDGYVVKMEQAVKNVFMSEDGLEIISEEKVQREFELYRIAVYRDVKVPHYPITSNCRRMRHMDRQADNAVSRIMTRAEIGRIVTSYEAVKGLEFMGTEEGSQGSIGGLKSRYQYVPRGRENLLLKFRVRKADFLVEDQVSFLVSEVQSYFPQFTVTGELFFEE